MFESRMFSLFRRSPFSKEVATILRHCLCLEPLSQAWYILRVSACWSASNYFVLKNQIMARSTKVQSETFQPLGLSHLVPSRIGISRMAPAPYSSFIAVSLFWSASNVEVSCYAIAGIGTVFGLRWSSIVSGRPGLRTAE